jgi:hypothetical protein
MSAVACRTIHFWKRSKSPVSTSVLNITTPQKVIQSITQMPCRLFEGNAK